MGDLKTTCLLFEIFISIFKIFSAIISDLHNSGSILKAKETGTLKQYLEIYIRLFDFNKPMKKKYLPYPIDLHGGFWTKSTDKLCIYYLSK